MKKTIRSVHSGDEQRPRRPSKSHVTNAARLVYGQRKSIAINELDEIVEMLEHNGEKPLYWDGLTDEEAAQMRKRENVRRYFRDIAVRLDGRPVRLFQCQVIKHETSTGEYYRSGKHKGEPKTHKTITRQWVDVADLLIAQTKPSGDVWNDMQQRIDLRDILQVFQNRLEELRDGIQVKIDGVDGVIKLVGEGFVFQPNLFGFADKSDAA